MTFGASFWSSDSGRDVTDLQVGGVAMQISPCMVRPLVGRGAVCGANCGQTLRIGTTTGEVLSPKVQVSRCSGLVAGDL